MEKTDIYHPKAVFALFLNQAEFNLVNAKSNVVHKSKIKKIKKINLNLCTYCIFKNYK